MANGPGVLDGPPIGFAIPHEIKTSPFVQEKNLPQKNPDMEGRATSLKGNPAEVQKEEDLRKAIQSEDDAMTKRLLEAAGIKAPVDHEIKQSIPQEIKKPQGFFASIWESISNFFRNLFR